MLSRVADSLYWMSRYLERAEHTVRMLDVNMGLMLDKSSTSAEGRWKRVLAALGNPQDVRWENDYYQLVHTLTFDADVPASVTSCLIEARENARQVRDEISSEQWQQLNRMYHWVIQPHSEFGLNTRLADFLPAVIDGVHLFQGVTDTTMSHGEEWQFIQMGRYLERAAAIANLLDLYQPEILHTPEVAAEGQQYQEWVGLLRCCTAFEAYCKVYTADITADQILEFLLLNPQFPHSLRYSIDCLRQALVAVQQSSGRPPVDELTRISGRLQASLSFVEVSDILAQDAGAYLAQHPAAVPADARPDLPVLYSILGGSRSRHVAAGAGRSTGDGFLSDTASDQVSVYEPGKREPDGGAHAPAQRQQSTLPLVFLVGKPALPGFLVPRSSGQQRPSLRYPGGTLATGDGGRSPGGTAAAAGGSAIAPAGSVERAGLAGGLRGFLRDAAAQRVCQTLARAARSGEIVGCPPPRRSAGAVAAVECLALSLVRLCTAQHARQLSHRRGARIPKGRMPGLCPHHDCAGAACGHSLPLRERLSLSWRGERGSVHGPMRPMPGWRPFCPRWGG